MPVTLSDVPCRECGALMSCLSTSSGSTYHCPSYCDAREVAKTMIAIEGPQMSLFQFEVLTRG